MEYYPSIKTCHDILHLFPWVFPNIKPSQRDNGLNPGGESYWWIFEHSAYLYFSPDSALDTDHPNVVAGEEGALDLSSSRSGIRCESTFTLNYRTLEDAFTAHNPLSGEWSLRVYATDDGLGDWDTSVIQVVDNMYQQMLLIFDNSSSGC